MSSEHVILIHGLGRTHHILQGLETYLQKQGYSTTNINYPSTKYDIDNLVEHHIAPVVTAHHDVEQLHFVTHSLGSILLRYYLHKHTLNNLKRTVMLAPPNKGSEVADWLMKTPVLRSIYRWQMGPAGQQLGSQSDVLKQLGPAQGEVGVIIGNQCNNPIFGRQFSLPNDGKVSIESAKLENMQDYIVLPVNHTFLMDDQVVREQVLHFLRHGQFQHQ